MSEQEKGANQDAAAEIKEEAASRARSLKSDAQAGAEEVKEEAASRARSVKSHAEAEAEGVKDQLKEVKEEVKGGEAQLGPTPLNHLWLPADESLIKDEPLTVGVPGGLDPILAYVPPSNPMR